MREVTPVRRFHQKTPQPFGTPIHAKRFHPGSLVSVGIAQVATAIQVIAVGQTVHSRAGLLGQKQLPHHDRRR
jgi:hypothetical protein